MWVIIGNNTWYNFLSRFNFPLTLNQLFLLLTYLFFEAGKMFRSSWNEEVWKAQELENKLLLTCFPVPTWLRREQQQLDRQKDSLWNTETKKARLAFGGVETSFPRGLQSCKHRACFFVMWLMAHSLNVLHGLVKNWQVIKCYSVAYQPLPKRMTVNARQPVR